jgi:zinc protease
LIFKKRIQILCCLLALLTINFGYAANAFAKNNSQSSGIIYPVVKRDSLLNGLQLITLEKPGTGNVSLQVRINSGALFDLAGKGGLADLTAGMLLKGSTGLPVKNLEESVEQLGLSINILVNWDSTDIAISGPVDATESMFDLLGRLIIMPVFDQKEFEGFQAQRIAALNTESVSPNELVNRKAAEIVYGSHPFGRPVRGTAESVKQITKFDLLYFHKKYYLANNALFIASGDITAETVTKLSRAKLGSWKKGEKVAPMFRAPEPLLARRVAILDKLDLPLALIAQNGLSRRAQDYFAALIMSEALRANLLKLPNASIALEFEPRTVEGPIAVRIKAAPENLLSSINKTLETIAAVQTTEPSSEQVEAIKTQIVNKFAEQIKNNPAEILFDVELYGLGRDYLVSYADRIKAVTPAEVQQAAQKYLKPQAVAIVLAGDLKAYEEELKKLGNGKATP